MADFAAVAGFNSRLLAANDSLASGTYRKKELFQTHHAFYSCTQENTCMGLTMFWYKSD